MVFVGGEAGVGKRRLCAPSPPARPGCSGLCENLTTPTPLGPFVDIAAQIGGPLPTPAEGGPTRRAMRSRELAERRAVVLEDVHWADEATLDVAARARTAHRRDAGARARDLPGRRGPRRPSAARRARRARLDARRLACRCRGSRSRRCGARGAVRRRRGRDPPSSPAGTRSTSPRCSPPARGGCRRRCATPCSRARLTRAGGAPAARGRGGRAGEDELWLLEAVAPDESRASTRASSRGSCARRATPSRSGTSWRGSRSRARRAAPSARAARGDPEWLAASGRRPDESRLAHHAEEAGDTAAVLEHAPAAARRAAAAARTGRPRRSTPGRSGTQAAWRRSGRGPLLRRYGKGAGVIGGSSRRSGLSARRSGSTAARRHAP